MSFGINHEIDKDLLEDVVWNRPGLTTAEYSGLGCHHLTGLAPESAVFFAKSSGIATIVPASFAGDVGLLDNLRESAELLLKSKYANCLQRYN